MDAHLRMSLTRRAMRFPLLAEMASSGGRLRRRPQVACHYIKVQIIKFP